MRTYTLQLQPYGHSYTANNPESLLTELQNAQVGQMYTLTITEHTPEEWEDLKAPKAPSSVWDRLRKPSGL